MLRNVGEVYEPFLNRGIDIGTFGMNLHQTCDVRLYQCVIYPVRLTITQMRSVKKFPCSARAFRARRVDLPVVNQLHPEALFSFRAVLTRVEFSYSLTYVTTFYAQYDIARLTSHYFATVIHITRRMHGKFDGDLGTSTTSHISSGCLVCRCRRSKSFSITSHNSILRCTVRCQMGLTKLGTSTRRMVIQPSLPARGCATTQRMWTGD